MRNTIKLSPLDFSPVPIRFQSQDKKRDPKSNQFIFSGEPAICASLQIRITLNNNAAVGLAVTLIYAGIVDRLLKVDGVIVQWQQIKQTNRIF